MFTTCSLKRSLADFRIKDTFFDAVDAEKQINDFLSNEADREGKAKAV